MPRRHPLRRPFITTCSLLASSATMLVVAACGGDDGAAGPTTCPTSAPAADSVCGKEDLQCSYGTCQTYACSQGKFVFTGGGCNPPPVCPPDGTPLPAEGSDCIGYGGFGVCEFPTACGLSRWASCGATWQLGPDPCDDGGVDAESDAAEDAGIADASASDATGD